ncbi:MAG TPA: DUF493 domain-containing protein [Candidatus Krumholzibacteria bacterium]|nr:DUF493 domain-containing protein [Candidatus Krumholzibacteria bacterium]
MSADTPNSQPSGPDPDKFRTLRSKLEVFHDWPHPYLFKFIVPRARQEELEAVFEGWEYRTRASRNGSWISLTCERVMESADAVIDVYERVDGIEGAFAL